MNDTIFYPPIDSNFEVLNFQQYAGKLNSLNATMIETDEKLIEVTEMDEVYVVAEYQSNSYFRTSKVFYKPSGRIKQKGLIFVSGGFPAGKWSYFNEAGNLVKSENHDSTYKFQFEDLYGYLKINDIPLTKGHSAAYRPSTEIYKALSDVGEPLWLINHVRSPIQHERITLSGITGKVVKREFRTVKGR